MTYLGTDEGPLNMGCDQCRSETVHSVFTVELGGIIARRCEHHAQGLRGAVWSNPQMGYVVLHDLAGFPEAAS